MLPAKKGIIPVNSAIINDDNAPCKEKHYWLVLYLSLQGALWSLMIALLTGMIPFFAGSILVINDSTIDC
jgi:hypothetical protein